jgi:hypothetical protein
MVVGDHGLARGAPWVFLKGGGRMKPRSTMRTTLYELIEAINEQVQPEEDRLVAGIVLHMLATGQIKFIHHLNGDKLP